MSEIQSLIKRARRYLKSADLLLRDGDYESCVSRAYYAMFYSAQAALLTKNLGYSSHKAVISAFGEQFVKVGVFPKEMGRELNRAFAKRQLAEYESSFVISREDAEGILNSAERVCSSCVRLSWRIIERMERGIFTASNSAPPADAVISPPAMVASSTPRDESAGKFTVCAGNQRRGR